MNGMLARDNFEIAARMFNNAFNPRTVNGQQNPKYDPNWNAVDEFRLCQSTLRLEQPVVTTSTKYTFPVLVNIQNQATGSFNTEIRLNMQDSFIPTEIFIGLGLPASSTDTTFQLKSYPAPATFAQYLQLQALYAGTMQLAINNVNYINNWDLNRHWCINQTQQTAAVGAGSPEDQLALSDDGFYPMQPFVLLLGSQNINLTINVPVAPSSVDSNTRLVILLRGILAQNSTVVN